MNFYEMRREFDRISRSIGDTTFDDYRDDWLNFAWEKLSEMFVIPSLKRTITFDAVENQQRYDLPYDYNGTEVSIMYDSGSNPKRLDPVDEAIMQLIYERRSGAMGPVEFYDLSKIAEADVASRSCTPTNNSKTVLCAAALATDAEYWIRFDPVTSGGAVINPGDYGFLISSVTAGVSYTLDREYRGPAGTFTGRVRPSETQQFKVYGIPDENITDAFTMTYYARPRRLYNDADVPEWPQMGLAIAYMAISIGYDYTQDEPAAKVWFGRAASKVSNLKNRINFKATLVTDLTVGSVSGRRTGPFPAPGAGVYYSGRR
ncbi:MAG: hypothetical protein WC822_01550 [Candidatus Paceibacterota bacterium]|jgi:hypothetical protein